jgi:hypothetical protein
MDHPSRFEIHFSQLPNQTWIIACKTILSSHLIRIFAWLGLAGSKGEHSQALLIA